MEHSPERKEESSDEQVSHMSESFHSHECFYRASTADVERSVTNCLQSPEYKRNHALERPVGCTPLTTTFLFMIHDC